MEHEKGTHIIAIGTHVGVENDVHWRLRRVQERVTGQRRKRQRGGKEKMSDWVHGRRGREWSWSRWTIPVQTIAPLNFLN